MKYHQLTTLIVIIVATIWLSNCGGGSRTYYWGGATLIEDKNGFNGLDPAIAMDSQGNTIAVWQYQDFDLEQNSSIWANRYTVEMGWGKMERIQTETTESGSLPSIVMQASTGNAWAVWTQVNPTLRIRNIWANHYTVDSGWGTAELIENNDQPASIPKIASDSQGNAIAMWSHREHDGSYLSYWANRYTAGSGWGTTELIHSIDNDGYGGTFKIAMDGQGNAIAISTLMDEDNNYNIWSNRYTVGSGWGVAELLEADAVHDSPQIAIDAQGNALALWSVWDPVLGIGNIWANRYTVDSGWGTAEMLRTEVPGTEQEGSNYHPTIAINAKGNAIAAWIRSSTHWDNNPRFRTDIYAARYINGLGWNAAVKLTSDVSNEPIGGHQVAIDDTDNAVVAWLRHRDDDDNRDDDDIKSDLWTNRYSEGEGWGKAEISIDDPGYFQSVSMANNAAGATFLVWSGNSDYLWETIHNIWALQLVEN